MDKKPTHRSTRKFITMKNYIPLYKPSFEYGKMEKSKKKIKSGPKMKPEYEYDYLFEELIESYFE